MDIKEKVFNHVDEKIDDIILNEGKISTSFGLDAVWGIYHEFRSQSNMMDYYYWNPFIGIIGNKLETYNFK